MNETWETILKRAVFPPKSAEEIFEVAARRARKVSSNLRTLQEIKRTEEKRVILASQYVSNLLKRVALRSPFIEDLHPFYRELVEVNIDVDEYKLCLARIYTISRLVAKIGREEAKKIMFSATINEARTARRRFFGRLKSLLEELDPCLQKLRETFRELKKIPDINPEVFSLIIAGAPNVGKSSLLKALTRAKPEIREYPFTTKQLIIGHLELATQRVQVIDTPGLLDRPLHDRNKIELNAILALKHLKGVIVFIFDPTETAGYPIDYQLNVYKEISSYIHSVPLIPVANKVDILSQNKLKAFLSILPAKDSKKLIFISALHEINIDFLLEQVAEYLGVGASDKPI